MQANFAVFLPIFLLSFEENASYKHRRSYKPRNSYKERQALDERPSVYKAKEAHFKEECLTDFKSKLGCKFRDSCCVKLHKDFVSEMQAFENFNLTLIPALQLQNVLSSVYRLRLLEDVHNGDRFRKGQDGNLSEDIEKMRQV